MNTKIVYVLTSDQNDYYLEQAYISTYSARYHNKDSYIILVTDTITIETCTNDKIRVDFLKLFDEIITIDATRFSTKAQRSRYLKTSIRNLITGDILYIDCDTVICDSLEDIDKTEGEFAAVLDYHTPISKKPEPQKKIIRDKIRIPIVSDNFFNGGVLYVKDTPGTHELFKNWEKDWEENSLKGINIDQPPLYRTLANTDVKIQELSGIWNTQPYENGLKYIHRSKILHLFATVPTNFHILTQPTEFVRLRENGYINDSLKDIIINPKDYFNPHITLASSVIVNSESLRCFNDLYKSFDGKPVWQAVILFLRKSYTFIDKYL